jgi:hypothetical protein
MDGGVGSHSDEQANEMRDQKQLSLVPEVALYHPKRGDGVRQNRARGENISSPIKRQHQRLMLLLLLLMLMLQYNSIRYALPNSNTRDGDSGTI